jgi:exodeoxyribonuclease V alpha subunit
MTTDEVTIRGEVTRLRTFGGTWGVGAVRLAAPPRREVNVTGEWLGVQSGDTVEVVGREVVHERFGAQIKASRIDVVAPASSAGVIAWLESRVAHLGRSRATALVERYGVPGIWQVIEREPSKLEELDGITAERAQQIRETYLAHLGERDRMVRLRGWGMTDGQIAKVLGEWGAETEARLRADPYALIDAVDGFGFLRADAVALRMGMRRDAPQRVCAALRYVLEQARGEGHCYVPRRRLVEQAARILECTDRDVAQHWEEFERRGRTIARGSSVYLRAIDQAEAAVAGFVFAATRVAAQVTKESGQ